jgi:hypothetical protein
MRYGPPDVVQPIEVEPARGAPSIALRAHTFAAAAAGQTCPSARDPRDQRISELIRAVAHTRRMPERTLHGRSCEG